MLIFENAELSLTVPITNSMAFLFTVIGEWWVEKKVSLGCYFERDIVALDVIPLKPSFLSMKTSFFF